MLCFDQRKHGQGFREAGLDVILHGCACSHPAGIYRKFEANAVFRRSSCQCHWTTVCSSTVKDSKLNCSWKMRGTSLDCREAGLAAAMSHVKSRKKHGAHRKKKVKGTSKHVCRCYCDGLKLAKSWRVPAKRRSQRCRKLLIWWHNGTHKNTSKLSTRERRHQESGSGRILVRHGLADDSFFFFL